MELKKSKRLLAVVGPTASGKTQLAVEVAHRLNTEVVSADSRQFYKEMQIGTARPLPSELKGIPHHFLGNRSVTEPYAAGSFALEAAQVLMQIFEKHDSAVLVGGSGLYVQALLSGIDDVPAAPPSLREQLNQISITKEGLESLKKKLTALDPKYAQHADLSNRQRVVRALEVCITTGKPYSSFLVKAQKQLPFEVIYVMMQWPRALLYERINARVDAMMQAGLWDEAIALQPYKQFPALQTVGYKEIYEGLEQGITKSEIISKIKQNTRRYAKRQLTWFGRIENLILLDPSDMERCISTCVELLRPQKKGTA